MVISSLGGTILNQTIIRFPKVAAYQPVINGVAGNLVAVNASRISTSLHQIRSQPGSQDISNRQLHRLSSADTYESSTIDDQLANIKADSKSTCLLLWFLVVPGHLVFNMFLYIFAFSGEEENTQDDMPSSVDQYEVQFMILYLIAASIQVGILLYASLPLVFWLWRKGIDPDSASIPYLTASGDLLGGLLLASAFILNELLSKEKLGAID